MALTVECKSVSERMKFRYSKYCRLYEIFLTNARSWVSAEHSFGIPLRINAWIFPTKFGDQKPSFATIANPYFIYGSDDRI